MDGIHSLGRIFAANPRNVHLENMRFATQPRKKARNMNNHHASTWRIIPISKWLINNHGDCKYPKDRVLGPLPNGHSWLINGDSQPLTSWDDPPSIRPRIPKKWNEKTKVEDNNDGVVSCVGLLEVYNTKLYWNWGCKSSY